MINRPDANAPGVCSAQRPIGDACTWGPKSRATTSEVGQLQSLATRRYLEPGCKTVGTVELKDGMNLEASQKTAAAAGVWSGFGLVSVQAWLDHHTSIAPLSQDMLWLLAFLVFLGIPGHVLVFGKGAKPFQRDWLDDPEERARRAVVFKRMFVWFISAGFVGTLWSLALMAVFH